MIKVTKAVFSRRWFWYALSTCNQGDAKRAAANREQTSDTIRG
jgi:hypothetical protein